MSELDKEIEKLEALATEHEKAYSKHPQIMGFISKFYSHQTFAKRCRKYAGYLKELKAYREANNEVQV